MKVKDAKQKIQEIIDPFLEEHGFKRKKGLEYFRVREGHVDRIGISIFADRVGGVRGTFGVGIIFPILDEWRRTNRVPGAATIGVPMHFLLPSHNYYDWNLSEVGDWKDFGSIVCDSIEKLALPFFQKYSSLSEVKASLESTDVRDWFVLNPTQRIETLALIECASGEAEKGMARIEKALEELAEAPMKETFPLMKLKETILAKLKEQQK